MGLPAISRARAVLAPDYEWLTEGQPTADLIAARGTLGTLQPA
jgi:hypothetical protein